MLKVVISLFLVLHGVVYMLYFGQSWRLFELQPGMSWPDGSWALSRLLSNEPVRLVASVACVVAAVGFILGGAGFFLEQAWWRALIVSAAVFASVAFVLLWDGTARALDNQGAIGLLINLAILAAVLVFQWPSFAY